jgi:hypothetical protein
LALILDFDSLFRKLSVVCIIDIIGIILSGVKNKGPAISFVTTVRSIWRLL